MTATDRQVSIFMAEDDGQYFLLLKEALDELKYEGRLEHFADGEELMGFLRNEGVGESAAKGGGLVILDLNMPRKNGHETLQEIRADETLRKLPVVIMTISRDPREVARCFEEGASSFITKPFDYEQLLETLSVFRQYWFEKVRIPDV